jgi:ubiE/COQ5 methyltransferase family
MFFKFRRMRAMDPLQVAMTGVRMGERYLQIFSSDATLTAGLAQKTGLSGQAALAALDERDAERATKAANKAGVLIEVQMTSTPGELPWTGESFDMVVIDNTAGVFSSLAEAPRNSLAAAARGVLRPGGRVELIERERTPPGQSEAALRSAGFKPVRVLAEKGGFRFIEGLKG